MRASRIILLLVALIAGGLAAFLATRTPPPEQVVVETPKLVEEAKTQILVAKAPIGVGQRLSEDTVEWQDWPETAVRAEYVNKQTLPDAVDQLTDAVARFEFFPGEPIIEQKLVRSAQGYLSAVLAQGMRGVAVRVDAQAAAGGYIFPNDRVDVVLSRSSSGGMISETILTNVKVLAIDRRLGEIGSTGAPSDPETPGADVFQGTALATLEVTPSQGELIINSTKTGALSLVLRSMADFQAAADNDKPSRSIRLIRAGQDSDVMSTSAGETVDVTPASYSEDSPGVEQPAGGIEQGQPN